MHSSKSFHFVLVHGAGHGAWCWYKMINKLRQAGHNVDAIDLASAGINSSDPREVAGLEHYSGPLVEIIKSFPKDKKVVLVGHSLAGISLTYLLEHLPERLHAAIYVAAMMLPSGAPANDMIQQLAREADFLDSCPETKLTMWFKKERTEEVLYNLSPPEDVVLAKSLLKPFPFLKLAQDTAAVVHTSERYGTVPRFYIKAKQDKAIPLELQEEYIRLTPPAGVFELNCDHSPFFSDVDAFVACLLQIAHIL